MIGHYTLCRTSRYRLRLVPYEQLAEGRLNRPTFFRKNALNRDEREVMQFFIQFFEYTVGIPTSSKISLLLAQLVIKSKSAFWRANGWIQTNALWPMPRHILPIAFQYPSPVYRALLPPDAF